MFEKYFEEYWVSEQELKEKIYSTLQILNQLEPEKWPREWLEYAEPTKEAREIAFALATNVPLIAGLRLDFTALSLEEILRVIAIAVDLALEGIRLDDLLPRMLYKQCSTFFLSIRYMLASEILVKKLGQEMNYDRDKISSFLGKEAWLSENSSDTLFVSKLAHEEVNRLFDTPEGSEYAQKIMDFEDKMDLYIRDNYIGLFYQSFVKLCMEGIIKNSDIINVQLDFEDKLTSKDAKTWLEDLEKQAKQSTNIRLGIESKWGGKRKIRDFTWTDENKYAFYCTVESIPKIPIKKKGKPEEISIWEDLYNQFEYRGDEAVRLISDKPPYDAIPQNLLLDAFRKWKNYEEDYANIKDEDSARMFLYRHALNILEFPLTYFKQRENCEIEYKLSTLDSHYRKGKILSEKRNNQVILTISQN